MTVKLNIFKDTKEMVNKDSETIKNNWDKKWGIYPNIGIGEPSTDGIIDKLKYLNYSACNAKYLHISFLTSSFI